MSHNSKPCISCDSCGKPQAKLMCSRCQRVYYCSRECQTTAWKHQHKSICVPSGNEEMSSLPKSPKQQTQPMSDKELMEHCRQFINCEYCGRGHPKQRCSRCQLVHYCSRECQTNHWKEQHKSACVSMEDSKKLHGTGVVGRACMEADDETRRQVLEGNPQCAICFEQPIIRPVVLDKCHHAFCSLCLRNWSSFRRTTTSTCPLCRQEIPNMAESLIQDISMLLVSAQKSNASESLVLAQFSKPLKRWNC